MRIAYVASTTIPSTKASSVQVMKMCSAFHRLGHEVSLYCNIASHGDLSSMYGVEAQWPIIGLHRPAGGLGRLVFARNVARMILTSRPKYDIVYSRCLYTSYRLACHQLPLLLELHALPRTRVHARFLAAILRSPALRALVFISDGLRRDFGTHYRLTGNVHVVVAPDGADAVPDPAYDVSAPCRRSHSMSSSIATYTGSLAPGKGVDMLMRVAARMPGVMFNILGGPPQLWRARYSRMATSNVVYRGWLPHAAVMRWQRSADVLLLPNQRSVMTDRGRVDIGSWTSPLKLFEYMASGVPIVASDLPVLREVLVHGSNCLLVDPNDLEAWVWALGRVLDSPALAHRLASRAIRDLNQRYTWTERAANVLSVLDE